MSQATAVDIECFEDLQDRLGRDAPVVTPTDDVEVFLAGFQAIEDAIEQEGFIMELALKQAEVAADQFHPKAFALQVFQPAGSQVAPPVVLHPAADGGLPEIASRFFTLDPLISQ